MIVHILPAAAGFPAVNYNTNKIDRNKGELMKVSGFGALEGLQELRPEDYKIHLRMMAANNQRVKKPQFHAVLSAKGKEYDKLTLTEIAAKWIESMGYAKQPYLIIFHKDTNNNHVHMVSVRVDQQGKKISDRFEKIRAVQQLNLILGIDEKQNAATHISTALTYQYATKAQFMMILESQGYVLQEVDGKFKVIKFGRELNEIQVSLAEEKIRGNRQNEQRKAQVKAIFYKYAASYSTALTKSRNSLTSEFAVVLREKFGIDLLFHASGDKPAYGYSIIDHSGKQVLKGGDVIPLRELLAIQSQQGTSKDHFAAYNSTVMTKNPVKEQIAYYRALLKAALYNYPDFIQGLQHQGLTITRNGENFKLHDPGMQTSVPLVDVTGEREYERVIQHFAESDDSQEFYSHQHHIQEFNLASDIDDEAINGRNRKRVKKARTNSR